MKQSKPSNNSGSSTNSSCTSNESVVIRRANEQQKTSNQSSGNCHAKSHDIKSLTPPSFRKEHFLGGGATGHSGGSGGLYKSASAVSVGRDFSGSLTPVMHQRKTSYQLQHSFRMGCGSASTTKNEISNLIRVRHSALGKSAPSLSPTSVNTNKALRRIKLSSEIQIVNLCSFRFVSSV